MQKSNYVYAKLFLYIQTYLVCTYSNPLNTGLTGKI